jgi:hypothetical protein
MPRGGNRGGGRPPKSDEQKLIQKLRKYEDIAIKALGDALKVKTSQKWAVPLYFAYMYGKPRQTLDADIKMKNVVVNVIPMDDKPDSQTE